MIGTSIKHTYKSTYQVIASIRATKIFFNIAWWAVCYKTSSLQDEKSKESIFIPESEG